MTEKGFKINANLVEQYLTYQREQERSHATLQKYKHDLYALIKFLGEKDLTKAALIDWKEYLIGSYATASVNAMLAAVNGYLRYMGWSELVVKPLKIQRSLFLEEEKELTREEYVRLVKAAQTKENERLSLVIQTICATGIRVSEKKVFPHNLRHLFARTFYTIEKDLSRLADILGHTNLFTTRIYTAESGVIHARQVERLKLIIT